MKFAAALTTHLEWTEAVEDLTRQISRQFRSEKLDVALLFIHPRFAPNFAALVGAIQTNIGARHLLGCTGASVIGLDQEIEHQPAISLLAGQMPGAATVPFQISAKDLEEASGPAFWHFQMEVDPQTEPRLLLLADPFSIQTVQLVHELSEAYPGAPLIGGVASGGQEAGDHRLFLDGQVIEEGAVGLALSGNVALHTLVSQGCRPIGAPFVITRAEKNIVFELGGQPPMKVLQEMLPGLPVQDQQLAKTALFLGRVVNEYQEEFGRGDFLIRTLIGHDPQSGALAVGDYLHTGQTVQFQVRDRATADEDLKHLLVQEKILLGKVRPRGAVLFSCLGRGESMYGEPHHDIRALHHELGPVPTGGFFCNGEIGPIGARAFVHGFTSVIGLFSEAGAEA